MKATHLKTLSARIDEVTKELIECGDLPSAMDFIDIDEYNDFLKQPITLSMFVPCDNGKPLEKPCEHDGCYLLTEAEAQKGECNTEKGCTCKTQSQYHKAQQAVIFEGWEVDHKYTYLRIRNKKKDTDLIFDNGIVPEVKMLNKEYNWYHIPIKTLTDLANATTDNPLKLK